VAADGCAKPEDGDRCDLTGVRATMFIFFVLSCFFLNYCRGGVLNLVLNLLHVTTLDHALDMCKF
jgi:hypothetical protein